MATTSVLGDDVTLAFDATAGLSVTAELVHPDGSADTAATVAPDGVDPASYPFTFTPSASGVWRVLFRAPGLPSVTETVEVGDDAAGPAPYATADTVQRLWRPLSPAEVAVADTLTRYASMIMRTRLPGLDGWIASGRLALSVAAFVAARMTTRVMKNPSGIAAETAGPWSVTYGSTGTEATGQLVLTDEDIALLTGTPPGTRRGTVRTVRTASRYLHCGRTRNWDAEV